MCQTHVFEIQIRQNIWFLNFLSTWHRSKFMIYKHMDYQCSESCWRHYYFHIYSSAMLVMDMWGVLHFLILGKNFCFAVKWFVSTYVHRQFNNKNCRSPCMLKIPSFCQLTTSLVGKCFNLSKHASNLA